MHLPKPETLKVQQLPVKQLHLAFESDAKQATTWLPPPCSVTSEVWQALSQLFGTHALPSYENPNWYRSYIYTFLRICPVCKLHYFKMLCWLLLTCDMLTTNINWPRSRLQLERDWRSQFNAHHGSLQVTNRVQSPCQYSGHIILSIRGNSPLGE